MDIFLNKLVQFYLNNTCKIVLAIGPRLTKLSHMKSQKSKEKGSVCLIHTLVLL